MEFIRRSFGGLIDADSSQKKIINFAGLMI
jgi:hypothetical protein